ncbi:effector binding domain-containing protein [Melghiribacillus thermohalophilus]|nr:effector binding domain-containing protein [Melghiribacillus thermohalophilus]
MIQILMYIHVNPKFTIRRLADHFQVSYRTIQRDLQELIEMGVPLYSEPGVNGGYRLINQGALPRQYTPSAQKVFGNLEYLDSFYAAGFCVEAPYDAREEMHLIVPKMWIELKKRVNEISQIRDTKTKIGISWMKEEGFTYYVTFEVKQEVTLPSDMVLTRVESGSYIRFTHRGALDKTAIDRTYYSIYDWLKQHAYEIDHNRPWLEMFDQRYSPGAPDNAYDILAPVTVINP